MQLFPKIVITYLIPNLSISKLVSHFPLSQNSTWQPQTTTVMNQLQGEPRNLRSYMTSAHNGFLMHIMKEKKSGCAGAASGVNYILNILTSYCCQLFTFEDILESP